HRPPGGLASTDARQSSADSWQCGPPGSGRLVKSSRRRARRQLHGIRIFFSSVREGAGPRATRRKRISVTSSDVRKTDPQQSLPEPPPIDLVAVKARQQATWASGDFGRIGVLLQIVGESLCEAVDLVSTEKVIDVAAGNGNASLAAA